MRSVQMNINVSGTKELAELNHHARDEEKEIRDGVVGEGQGLSEEDESRINNEDVEVRDNGHVRGVQARAVIQRPQQQPQGPVVRWERFLPVRSLKVLLVENDDSTRHVVSALLRNCGYEVTAVANGLLAWRILKDLPNHVDLILTEVVMPTLSGIGLLCKIMSHKTCKNIPVIMMSSHDSLGIVFKCLSKGAVDFLVKPIRKNELKNLWQHVWRKCHSSSGSGSESGVGTRRSTRSGNAEETDNNTGSSEENGNWSNGLNVRDGSDHGSGTQSSWTKRAVEVDSPQPMLPWDQLADPPDSTCAQVIHSRAEAFGNNWEPMTATRECQLRDNELENSAMHKDLEVREPKNLDLQQDPSEKVLSNTTGSNKDKLLGLNLKKDDNQFEKEPLVLRGGEPNGEQRNRSEDQMDVAANRTDPQIERSTIDLSKLCASKDGTIYDTKELPSLELSLKRLRDIEDIGTSTHDRNVLRHSNLSAFSRYNSASTGNQAPTGNVGSCSRLDNSPNAAETESMQNLQFNSNGTLPNQHSTGSSNKNDMGSTTNNALTKPATFNDKSALKSTVKFMNPSSVFQPEKNGHFSPLQSVKPGKADGVTDDTGLTQGREMQQQVQVQHHHHHYHHHHHHVHKLQQQQQQNLLSDDDLSSKSMAAAALQCGSSNVLGAPIEGNGMIHSLNGSASGSNHGSNGQNCSSIVVNNGGINVESDNGIAPKDEAGGASGSGSGSGVDQNRFVGRVAALDKFRQKRKQRCFEKKVRYQSRKKLAEQRPRVRGQFVRQVAYESKSKDTNS